MEKGNEGSFEINNMSFDLLPCFEKQKSKMSQEKAVVFCENEILKLNSESIIKNEQKEVEILDINKNLLCRGCNRLPLYQKIYNTASNLYSWYDEK